MIRRSRFRLALLSIAAVAATSGCATFDNSDTVALVDGVEITNDDFATLATEYFATPEAFGAEPVENGHANASQSRGLLGALVRQQQVNRFLADRGVDASEIRRVFRETAMAGSPVATTSERMQQLVADVDPTATAQVLALVDAATTEELRSLYADNPASTGLICTRHILVETEAEAFAVLDELAAGADFASLAAERSIEPTAAETGGALANGANQCIPIQTVRQTFDPGFTVGALAAREGIPSQPVESSFGWHVILHRPWDEVAASITELHLPGDSGGYLLDGAIATAEVTVDPRFGVWDPAISSVVPAG